MVRRLVGKHLDHDIAFLCFHHHSILGKFLNRLLAEGRRGRNRTRSNGYTSNFDSVFSDLLVVNGSSRNLVDHFDTFDDMAKSRKLTRELRLIGDDKKKFRTCTVCIARQQRCGQSSLREWSVADFRLEA